MSLMLRPNVIEMIEESFGVSTSSTRAASISAERQALLFDCLPKSSQIRFQLEFVPTPIVDEEPERWDGLS